VVEAAGIHRHVAAAVGDADLEPAVAVEHAFEDQVADGESRIERVADDVVEIVRRQPTALGEPHRVQEEEDAELLGRGEHRGEAWRGEFLAIDVGAELDAAHAEVLDAAAHLGHRQLGRLHRQGAHGDEAVGMGGGDLGQVVVDQPRGLASQLGIGPVEVLRRRRRDRLDVDAEPVHVGDAPRRGRDLLVDVDHLLAVDLARLRRGEEERRLLLDGVVRRRQHLRLLRQHVAVDVDGQAGDAARFRMRMRGGLVRAAGIEHRVLRLPAFLSHRRWRRRGSSRPTPP
jgi:hypothetical protein